MELIKKNLVAIVLFLSATIGGYVWSLIQKGGEVEFKTKVEEIIKEKLDDAHIIETLLKSRQVEEFKKQAGEDLRDAIIEDVTKKDSLKINQNAYFGKELGIRDEDVTPLMLQLLKEYKEGKLVKQQDIQPRRNPNTIEL